MSDEDLKRAAAMMGEDPKSAPLVEAWLDAREQERDEFDIVIAGPMADDFLVDHDGQEYVVSSNATVYPVSELERCAPLFAGRPVFYKHEGDSLAVRTRVLQGDKKRVGHLERAWYEQSTKEVHAVLRVTSAHWRAVFRHRHDRWKYRFSMDINVLSTTYNGFDIVDKINTIFSVDLVDWAACGGRFLNAPAMTEEELADSRACMKIMVRRQLNDQ